MRLSLGGDAIDWITNMSFPRTHSSISTLVSLLLKNWGSYLMGLILSILATSLASCWFALPATMAS